MPQETFIIIILHMATPSDLAIETLVIIIGKSLIANIG